MQIECAGERMTLCADRALLWPARRTLFVADTHFGKVGVFRQAGLAMPEGIDDHDLARLSRLIGTHDIGRLIILGDFFHGRPVASEAFIRQFTAWLARHPDLRIDVVAGNHDRHGGAGLFAARVQWHAGALPLAPFLLAHAFIEDGKGYVLCGHLHPVLRLNSHSGDHARLPAFWFTPRGATLPSFGSFTGGAVIRPGDCDRVYVIADQEVLPIPPAIVNPR